MKINFICDFKKLFNTQYGCIRKTFLLLKRNAWLKNRKFVPIFAEHHFSDFICSGFESWNSKTLSATDYGRMMAKSLIDIPNPNRYSLKVKTSLMFRVFLETMTLYFSTHNWLCVHKMLNNGLNHGLLEHSNL